MDLTNRMDMYHHNMWKDMRHQGVLQSLPIRAESTKKGDEQCTDLGTAKYGLKYANSKGLAIARTFGGAVVCALPWEYVVETRERLNEFCADMGREYLLHKRNKVTCYREEAIPEQIREDTLDPNDPTGT